MSFVRYSTSRPQELVLADCNSIDPLLVSLLSLCTPHKHEQHIVHLINQLPFIKINAKRMFDKEMHNQIYIVGESRTVFSCHMDIVGEVGKHNIERGTVDKIFLMEKADKKDYGMLYGAKRFDKDGEEPKYIGCPLGSDDKVGVYILLKMIEANIPGKYIFHTGEECGGLGSGSLAKNHPKLFANIDRAIAFDRANYGDIISFQKGHRCCSKEFGDALAEALNVGMPPKQLFKSEVTGTFTDTASYMELVPECTNISVGYWDQHGSGEHFDYYWLQKWLLPAILKINYEALPIHRDPKKKEYPNTHYGYNGVHNNQQLGSKVKQKSWDTCLPNDTYFEFPTWEPALGYVEEAHPEVLRIAVGRAVSNLSYGVKKDEFINWLVNTMEFNAIMAEEIISLRASLDIATGKVPVKQEIITVADREEELPNIEKVTLITELLKVAVEPGIILYGVYKGWLNDYVNKAKKFLRKNKNKLEYNEAETEKFNKIFFALATLIDCSKINSPTVEDLLNKVEQYITEHGNEEGFEVPSKIKKEAEDTLEEEIVQHQLIVH